MISIDDDTGALLALSQALIGIVAILGDLIALFCARLKDGLLPQVTLVFWMLTMLAATVGETGGDALSMALKLGYIQSTLLFLGLFAAVFTAQLFTKRFTMAFYWGLVLATMAVGTTTSDYLHRTVGLGYIQSSAMLLWAVLAVLITWRHAMGSVEFGDITSPKNKLFYWVTILVCNTLGTSLGDFVGSTEKLGFERGAMVFTGLIACLAALHFFTELSGACLFWTAYVLIRPLGTALGDILTRPHAEGGLALGSITSSLTILAAMVVMIALSYRHQARAHAA